MPVFDGHWYPWVALRELGRKYREKEGPVETHALLEKVRARCASCEERCPLVGEPSDPPEDLREAGGS